MKVLLSWLKEFLPSDPSIGEVKDALLSVGIEVDSVEYLGKGFEDVAVAKIEEMGKHPNADKLSVCEVTDGKERYHIVCGAHNMVAGDHVALGRIGAKLPNGMTLKRSKIRGEESFGMLCSESELGLSDEHDGILILDRDTVLGEPLAKVIGRDDWLLDLELTPNRGDCLGLHGVAREVASAMNVSPKVPHGGDEGPKEVRVPTAIEDPEACLRFTLQKIEGVEVKASPLETRHRIEASGIRAINSIVDLTNYSLMERSQPQHAYDADKVQGPIVVRRAKNGEKLLCLDEVERKLTSEDLVIADDSGAIGLAGLMGGLSTAVTETSVNVILESACFHPSVIRKTARRLNLHTDASHRFERNVDPNGCWSASRATCERIVQAAGGRVTMGSDLRGKMPESKSIHLRQDTIRRILGQEIPQAGEYLSKLELSVTKIGDGWNVEIPTRRPDLEREIDLVEEVARVHGYGKFKSVIPEIIHHEWESREFYLIEKVRDALVAQGLHETVTYSFFDDDFLEKFPPDGKALEVANPLTSEMSVMRTSLIPSLLQVWKTSASRQAERGAFFELGRVYFEAEEKTKTPAREERRLGILLSGRADDFHCWEASRKSDFFAIKGAFDGALLDLGLEGFEYSKDDLPEYLHPGKSARIEFRKKTLGYVGALHPTLSEENEVPETWVLEVSLDPILKALSQRRMKSKEFSNFPMIRRDLAFVVKQEIQAGELLQAIEKSKSSNLLQTCLFDLYEGKGVPKGMKSLAFTLTFLSMEKTLKDKEIDKSISKIVQSVEKACGATLR